MGDAVRSLLLKWILGISAGTAIIAATSPWFVRSYEPLHADAVRKAWTLQPNLRYRWRSEGYATSTIGPHGMPGRTSLASSDGTRWRIALWGDSQAEGVCLDDSLKLFAQCETASNGMMAFLPLARSGEDASDWATQMPFVERPLDLDAHAIFVVDLTDLLAAVSAPKPEPDPSDAVAAKSAIAARFPAFVIQGGKHLLFKSDESTPRKLRFGIGPVEKPTTASTTTPPQTVADDNQEWRRSLAVLRRASTLPIVIVYAPQRPQIIDGQVLRDDLSADSFEKMTKAAAAMGIPVINAGPALLKQADSGNWPHGFHNGQFGVGHLNADGYAAIASLIVEAVEATLAE